MNMRINCFFTTPTKGMELLEMLYLKKNYFEKDSKRTGNNFEFLYKGITYPFNESDDIEFLMNEFISSSKDDEIIVNNQSFKIFSDLGYIQEKKNFYYTLTPEFIAFFKIIWAEKGSLKEISKMYND